ncbi:MAG: hypothetical protein IT422_24215 [Pirellulaceae bacterium]|nr:hypothetical protein [Pirellulaceae bacterium]
MKMLRYLPRFAEADRRLITLAEHETWPRERIDTYQLDSINTLWKHAIQSVPYYMAIHSEQNLPMRFDCLAEFHDSVPLLSKQTVREHPELFLSRVKTRGFWCGTGGSTGAPMKVYWECKAHLEMLRTKYRAFQMWGIDYLDRIAFLWGHSTYFQAGLKGHIARLRQPAEDYARSRLRLSAYQVGAEQLTKYLRQLQRFRPVALYGYPTAIRLLAEQARRESCKLDSLRHVVVTGEPIDDATMDTIKDALDANVVIEYGSVDCGHMAHQWPDGTLRVREDVVHLETFAQEQTGNAIVVTPLHNLAFPLLRYDLSDLTSHPVQMPERGFSILQDVTGRMNDFLMLKDGGVAHSARLDAFFKYQCKGIRRFHVHQHRAGNVEVFVELNQPDANMPQYIEEQLRQIVGYHVSAQVVEEIELSKAGKHRLLISDMASRLLPPASSQ